MSEVSANEDGEQGTEDSGGRATKKMKHGVLSNGETPGGEQASTHVRHKPLSKDRRPSSENPTLLSGFQKSGYRAIRHLRGSVGIKSLDGRFISQFAPFLPGVMLSLFD
jgi:hypothetical protein